MGLAGAMSPLPECRSHKALAVGAGMGGPCLLGTMEGVESALQGSSIAAPPLQCTGLGVMPTGAGLGVL